jgi:DNA-binding NtrC family response regulator
VQLSDGVMPGELHALGLARHVQAAYPALKVVLMSGYAQQLDAWTSLGFEIIPKSCSPAVLAEAMERAAAGRPMQGTQGMQGEESGHAALGCQAKGKSMRRAWRAVGFQPIL